MLKNLNTIYTHETSDSFTDYERKFKNDGGLSFWATIGEGNNVWGSNSWKEQRALNYMGVKDGTTMNDFIYKQFFNEDGELNEQRVQDLYKNTGGKWEDTGSSSGNFKAVKQYITDLAQLQDAEIKTQDKFVELGKTIKDSFSSAIVDGFTTSMKMLGEQITDMKHDADDYMNSWMSIGEKMMDAIGPAMTQAGLAMITIDPEHWYNGAAVVAAGGVVSLMAGMFANNQKNDDEEKRLQSLKDLLSDIIDQARTDAEYYQRNVLHSKALSEAELISNQSVHDAIIAPNGNIISTDPEDYLIATKTPGNYANLNGGAPVVNFNLIDQSTGVQVSEVKQRKNQDGSIDISAVVISKVSQAIADGELDDAFAAKEMRINGKSYAY
ncbi:MAG: hypothetical protein Q4E99_06365 [Bacillota bacterium]|nr:hypothetical protein [Bacillota bacterium]